VPVAADGFRCWRRRSKRGFELIGVELVGIVIAELRPVLLE
jgi:hypothetical protein